MRDPLRRLHSYHSYHGDYGSQTKTYDSIKHSPSSIETTNSLPRSDWAAVEDRDVLNRNALLDELDYVVAPRLHASELMASSIFQSSGSPSEELIEATLFRASESESFGFSLSNGINATGVFIGAIKEQSPASDKLRPYDRILQVSCFCGNDCIYV